MTFDQWITIAALLAGPVGVAIGWGLSELGDARKANAQQQAAERSESQARCLALLATASILDGEGRGLAHAMYERGTTGRTSRDQMKESTDRFNAAMANLDRLILESDVLGPHGLADVGRDIQAAARDLIQVVSAMQAQLMASDVEKVQKESLPAMEAAVAAATEKVRSLLGVAST